MKIGITSIYSFRPHPEHLYFLAKILKAKGHELSFLTCEASVPYCYPKLLRQQGSLKECPKCLLGGMRSYQPGKYRHMDSKRRAKLPEDVLDEICASSSYTLGRVETKADQIEDEVLSLRTSLYIAADIAVQNTLDWVKEEELEGIICFNGRMDMTRAVTYACELSGLPYVTIERPWFGNGLHMIPNANCLSLTQRTRLNRFYSDKPLTASQASLAGKLAAQRFLKKNDLEWRLYNKNSKPLVWPVNTEGLRVLVLPSSKNEFDGHPEWRSSWDDYTVAIDALLGRLSLSHSNCVLRCHPNWAEYIGRRDGVKSERHYQAWAERNKVFSIGSADPADTYQLITQADIIVVNGSTSGYEAALCGKKVICLGLAAYQDAGLCVMIKDDNSWDKLEDLRRHDPRKVIRQALRYAYTQARRFPQYVDYVRADSTTSYHYFDGADPDRIIRMLKTGIVEPDDDLVADNEIDEDGIVTAVENRDWQKLIDWDEVLQANVPFVIKRRFMLRWVDMVRNVLPRGDL